ncbi:SAP30-binding protein isoform X3 [Citrus clementina]|uniref:SAP30-binding protein isoform X3 n=1 Tax=Citrus clementina TaxID=85681 RepID=UPI000CECE3EB|nr:SAP30-binding protein isoform X3 [Citrus x clementina]
MSSKKKQAEGIALLSMYNDDEDDEEMEDLEEEEEEEEQRRENQEDEGNREAKNLEEDLRMNGGDDAVAGDETSTPLQPHVDAPAASGSRRRGRGRFTIVDYGHDEVAMSPEPEEGEIDLRRAHADDVQERTVLGYDQASEQLEKSEPDATAWSMMESETVIVEESIEVKEEEVDPLDKFLPPPPKVKCSEELQRKIDKFLGLKRIGKSFNAEVRNRKDYRNPDFLLHAVRYQDIDQIGSCFRKDVFDPHGYDKSDYYDEIEADMRRERERKDQENKKNQKVEFIAGGVQAGIIAGAQKPNIPMPVASGLQSVPMATDAVARDGRQNKKSKWDKVDGDRRNPLPSVGQDSLSAVGAHAAILSAANAGAGYTAFAQQRRREAEERRSSERKLERKS